MFKAFDEHLESLPLMQKSVSIPMDLVTPDEIDAYVKKHYPAWRVVSVTGHHAIIEENPSLKKFRWVNPITEEVMGRDVVESGPILDDEALQVEDPELWEQITEWPEPWFTLVKDVIHTHTSLRWSDDAVASSAGKFLRSRGIKKVIIDPSRMSDEDLQAIQPYLSPGTVSVRLSPPRAAKEEELDNA